MRKKHEKIDILLAKIEETGIFRNDGRGQIYFYDRTQGIWIRQKPLTARQNLSVILRKEHVVLHREELVALQREIEEWPSLTEPRLAIDTPTNLIAVKNGVVDLVTGQLMDFDPKHFLRFALDFTFYKDVKKLPESSAWSQFAASSLGLDVKELDMAPLWRLFQEAFFFPLTNLGNAKKMVIFLGPPHCGKSIILKIMERLIGEDAFVSLSFEDMTQRFRGSLMEGHRVVISHEMPLKPLRRLDVVKKIISGDSIIIEEKCQNAKKYTPRVNIVFAANNMPTLAEPDAGGAFADRLLVVPFQKVAHQDNDFLEKLWADRDIFLTLAAKMMGDFIKRGLAFTQCPKGEKILEEFKSESFSLSAFIDEKFERKNGARICFADFFEAYVTFCDEVVVPAVSKTEVKNALLQMGITFERARVHGRPNAVSCLIGLEKKTDSGISHVLHAKSEP